MHSKNPALTYVTASDEAFAAGLLVSVASFVWQHRDAESLRVCVIDGGLEEETWLAFERNFQRWAGEASIEVQLEKWPGDLERWHAFPPHWGSWAVYSSMDVFLRELEGWVVFADVDLFHGSAVWGQLDLVANHASGVGAVIEPFKLTSEADKYVHLVRPEIQGWVDYVNTGFLVVNRDQFDRESFVEFLDKLEPDVLERKSGKRSLFDQSLLNGYLAGDLAILPPNFNRAVRDGRDFRFGGEASNLHFAGVPKPWKDESNTAPERYATWAGASAGLGLGDEELLLSSYNLEQTLADRLQAFRYRLAGKREKLAAIEARFDEGELRALFKTVKEWF